MVQLQNKVQAEILKLIQDLDNQNTYISTYLYLKEGPNFTVNVTDPNNQFNEIEKQYVPVVFDGVIGEIQPSAGLVYDESGTVTLSFFPYNHLYLQAYNTLEEFKQTYSGYG
jgi:hypothetical protein